MMLDKGVQNVDIKSFYIWRKVYWDGCICYACAPDSEAQL